MGFKSTFIPNRVLRSTVRLLVRTMELEVSTETRQQHAHATHIFVTQGTRTKHALNTLSPPRGSQCSLREGGRSKGSRPSIYRRLGDGRHSPLTERWNWTFFSGKTRRRDGTGKDTA